MNPKKQNFLFLLCLEIIRSKVKSQKALLCINIDILLKYFHVKMFARRFKEILLLMLLFVFPCVCLRKLYRREKKPENEVMTY